jgi:hypothetical protein
MQHNFQHGENDSYLSKDELPPSGGQLTSNTKPTRQLQDLRDVRRVQKYENSSSHFESCQLNMSEEQPINKVETGNPYVALTKENYKPKNFELTLQEADREQDEEQEKYEENKEEYQHNPMSDLEDDCAVREANLTEPEQYHHQQLHLDDDNEDEDGFLDKLQSVDPIVDITDHDLNPSPPKKLNQQPSQTPVLQSCFDNTKRFKRLNNTKISERFPSDAIEQVRDLQPRE